MMRSTQEPPRLAPPGAGIPWWERLVARRLLLPLSSWRTPWDQVPALMSRQCDELVRAIREVPEADRTRRVLVRRLPGLEDSSRYWSCYMVIEHLRLVNHRMVQVIGSLTSGGPLPPGPDRIEQFKPDPGAGPTSIEGYRSTVNEFSRVVGSATPEGRASRATVPHPWFGPLTAAQWVSFTPMHQSIHQAQLRAIGRMLHEHRERLGDVQGR